MLKYIQVESCFAQVPDYVVKRTVNMKIAIIGFSGSGKSTLAKIISERLEIPILHLDTVHHLPMWQERDRNSEIEIVDEFLASNKSWVIDGNYSKVCFEKRMETADRIIYLCFGRLSCFFRAYRRYRKYKNTSRPDMTEGCQEKFDREFITWLLFTGRKKKRRRRFDEVEERYPDKTIKIKNQKQLNKLIQNICDNTFV